MQSEASWTSALVLGSLGWALLARKPADGLWPVLIALACTLIWVGSSSLVSHLLEPWILVRLPQEATALFANSAILLAGWVACVIFVFLAARHVVLTSWVLAAFMILWAVSAIVGPNVGSQDQFLTHVLMAGPVALLAAVLALPFRLRSAAK